MSEFFFDTSALVKRYHVEPGTERVDAILDDPDAEIFISSLAIIESVSAFKRKHNRGEVTEQEMTNLISVFFREALDDFVILPLEESVMTFSFDLILDEDLRTLDSLQLSAGLSLASEIENLTFVTADEKLVEIADQRGLETVRPG